MAIGFRVLIMKAENLRKLKINGFPVPDFIVVDSPSDVKIDGLPDKKICVTFLFRS